MKLHFFHPVLATFVILFYFFSNLMANRLITAFGSSLSDTWLRFLTCMYARVPRMTWTSWIRSQCEWKRLRSCTLNLLVFHIRLQVWLIFYFILFYFYRFTSLSWFDDFKGICNTFLMRPFLMIVILIQPSCHFDLMVWTCPLTVNLISLPDLNGNYRFIQMLLQTVNMHLT